MSRRSIFSGKLRGLSEYAGTVVKSRSVLLPSLVVAGAVLVAIDLIAPGASAAGRGPDRATVGVELGVAPPMTRGSAQDFAFGLGWAKRPVVVGGDAFVGYAQAYDAQDRQGMFAGLLATVGVAPPTRWAVQPMLDLHVGGMYLVHSPRGVSGEPPPDKRLDGGFVVGMTAGATIAMSESTGLLLGVRGLVPLFELEGLADGEAARPWMLLAHVGIHVF